MSFEWRKAHQPRLAVNPEDSRRLYLTNLFDRAANGDLFAGDELSKVAMGGYPLARELVSRLDNLKITPIEPVVPSPTPKKFGLEETIFCLTHPLAAINTKLRQIGVSIEAAGPPAGTTIEEFPNLPIHVAAALIDTARDLQPDGVQLKDWSQADQQRLLRGERPKGVPIHRNQ